MEFDDIDDVATAPKLYYDAISSHARSCQMLIEILKIDVDLKSTDSMNDLSFCETYTWMNSFFKLPTLVDGGLTLCSAHSILIYLCRKYDSKNLSNLCPCDYMTRQKITSMLFYEGCILHRCLSHLMTDIILAKYPNFNMEYHKTEVLNVYHSLNTFLNGHSFMIANFLTIADISVLSSVSALSIIFPIDHEKFPKLFDWFEGLKKMDFYNCNAEGLLKMRYILKKVGNFPFPSPFEMRSEKNNIRKSEQNTRKREEEQKKTTKNFQNSSQTYESESAESIENMSGYTAGNKGNGKSLKESETFNFNDNYFINEPKCNFCFHAEPANSEAVKVGTIMNVTGDKDSREVSEIYKKPQAVVHSSTDDSPKLHRNVQHPVANNMKDGVQQHFACNCCCRKKLCNATQKELVKRHSEKAIKSKGESPKKSDKNGKGIDVHDVESVERDSSSVSDSEDNPNNGSAKQHQDLNHNCNKICQCCCSQNKKVHKDKHNDNKLTAADEKNSNDTTVAAETNLEVKTDSNANNENNRLTNKEVEDLMANVQKLERIIEIYDKELKNNNQISTVVSDSFSTDSVTTSFPRNCDPAISSFQQKSHACICHNKPNTAEQFCQQTGSRVEALEFNEITHVVMPQFLVRNLEKLECPATSTDSKDDTQKSDRLEAGSNCNQCQNNWGFDKFKNTSEQLDNKILFDIILYLLNAKTVCKSKNKCRCNGCCRTQKVINSKIPRLISHSPSCANGQKYKNSKLVSGEIHCDCLD